jgi:Flp pilus assembly protein TadD
MRSCTLAIVTWAFMLAGCASTGAQDTHVLSGEAPVEHVISRADQALAEGDFLAAEILYQQALSRQPSAEVWYRLGIAQLRGGSTGEAMWAFRQALDLNPDHPRALERVGLHLTTRDRADEARPFVARLLELEPDNWRAHNALGVLADLEGRHTEAAERFAAAIERNPESATLWSNLGYSHYLDGDDQAAQRAIGTALSLEPGHTAARHNLALLMARQRRYDEALRIMQVARGEAQAYSDIGYLAFRMGDLAKAEELLKEAIQRSRTFNREAHQHLAAVREARTQRR